MHDGGIVSHVLSLGGEIPKRKPLVHHITNYVTANDCANILLALGASPIMADAIEEVGEIVSLSSALVLNIGTLNRRTADSMLFAGEQANERRIPVILDPVGVGASAFRSETAAYLLQKVSFSVIRGNMSEIRFLSGLGGGAKGVDASDGDVDLGVQGGIEAATALSLQAGCSVALTGESDIVSDGCRTVCIRNGNPLLRSVTGTGCMCTSLVGAFCAVSPDSFLAAVAGVLCMGIAGELACECGEHHGNGSYRAALLDAVSMMTAKKILEKVRIEVL